MKIITLHQPWASLVALGLKKYETRHWTTDYRGPLLIHAAARKPKFEEWGGLSPEVRHHPSVKRLARNRLGRSPYAGDHVPIDFPLGCIVAIASLHACPKMRLKSQTRPECWDALLMGDRPDNVFVEDQSPIERSVGCWEPGRYALQLDNVRNIEPIPFKSRQGKLLAAPPEIVALVNQQLLEVA